MEFNGVEFVPQLEEVEVEKVSRWGWRCKYCETWNEETTDPQGCEFLRCEFCGQRYRIKGK